MTLYYEGALLGLCTFFAIGIFHPIVIKTEYYFGIRPWWIFLVGGIVCIVGALFIESIFWSALLGIVGFSSLWSIGELFHQRQRVIKGWFPMNPKRKQEYEKELKWHFHSKNFRERVRDREKKVLEKAMQAEMQKK